jgi:hypothetical protein
MCDEFWHGTGCGPTCPEEARSAQVTVLRECPPPGLEAQIDYGKLETWLDPRSRRRRTVWAFVMVLACSRHMFVRPTLVMAQAEWCALAAAATGTLKLDVGVAERPQRPGVTIFGVVQGTALNLTAAQLTF